MLHKLIILILFVSSAVSAQTIYVDPATSAAMLVAANLLKEEQENTTEEQKKLEKAQAFVATQMVRANKIQEKVFKGLNEVSGTVQNAIQIKEIYRELQRSGRYVKEIGQLVQKHPEYSIFGAKASEYTYRFTLESTTKVSDILKSNELNLATAGDRYRLLDQVAYSVRMFNINLLEIKLQIERAVRLGFIKAINPFQGYINTDKTIVENIMAKYKYHF